MIRLLALAVIAVLVAAIGPGAPAQAPASSTTVTAPVAVPVVQHSTPRAEPPGADLALAGKVVVIDPGHQLGNAAHTRQINELVDAGNGLRKPCNTTGTATNGGFPEATFTWRVARKVRKRLRALGAEVVLTRTTNSRRDWGPCVDVRGRFGNAGFRGRQQPADLKLSIHGDG
ncbi:MAG TPA: N-acetylmuramoyl-L-alanine amidase, partial [Acidimicrobiales bacterium]